MSWTLGLIGPEAKDAVSALIRALRDKNGWVRASAASALGYIGEGAKEAVPALIPLLQDEDATVRANVTYAFI